MRRFGIILAAVFGLCVVYVLGHCALIEVGQEVIVLRTQSDDAGWHETRLWIVDHEGSPWLHGGNSQWMRELRQNPVVEVTRAGQTRRYRAHLVSGPHPELHERFRAKYGIAEDWVRTLAPDGEDTTPVRLEALDPPRP